MHTRNRRNSDRRLNRAGENHPDTRRSKRAAARARLEQIRRAKPSRKQVRTAMLATVPSTALFGFAGPQVAGTAGATVISMPLLQPELVPDDETGVAAVPRPDSPPAAVEASYYGKGFAGRPTASGERFDPERLTAAHRTLPFGTLVKVANAATGKSAIVRINDRGPFHGNREIDLSTAAARRIGMLASGTAKVTLKVIGKA